MPNGGGPSYINCKGCGKNETTTDAPLCWECQQVAIKLLKEGVKTGSTPSVTRMEVRMDSLERDFGQLKEEFDRFVSHIRSAY
jgi:hypothetical protein